MNTEDELRARVVSLEQELNDLKGKEMARGFRKRSGRMVWGVPLYDIAFGPDPENGELRGHARGIYAAGDVATGVVANGGVAFGVVAIGGLAVGGLSIGGAAVGLIALGGAALGALAMGGLAVGLVSFGGAAIGYYAMGGEAFGKYVLSADRQDIEAIQFFSKWLPEQMVKRFGG